MLTPALQGELRRAWRSSPIFAAQVRADDFRRPARAGSDGWQPVEPRAEDSHVRGGARPFLPFTGPTGGNVQRASPRWRRVRSCLQSRLRDRSPATSAASACSPASWALALPPSSTNPCRRVRRHGRRLPAPHRSLQGRGDQRPRPRRIIASTAQADLARPKWIRPRTPGRPPSGLRRRGCSCGRGGRRRAGRRRCWRAGRARPSGRRAAGRGHRSRSPATAFRPAC